MQVPINAHADVGFGAEPLDLSLLINRRLRPTQIRNLLIWEPNEKQWHAPQNQSSSIGIQVRVLHFWTEYCAACKHEWPVLLMFDRFVASNYRDRVQLLHISEGTPSESMRDYLASHASVMPSTSHYQDTQGQIASELRRLLVNRDLPLPSTILLDDSGRIQYVFAGSVKGRSAELISSIEALIGRRAPVRLRRRPIMRVNSSQRQDVSATAMRQPILDKLGDMIKDAILCYYILGVTDERCYAQILVHWRR